MKQPFEEFYLYVYGFLIFFSDSETEGQNHKRGLEDMFPKHEDSNLQPHTSVTLVCSPSQIRAIIFTCSYILVNISELYICYYNISPPQAVAIII